MELNSEMKRQLMSMAGITDVAEFDQLVHRLAPSAAQAVQEKMKQSPFAVPLMRMVAAFEARGLDKLEGDVGRQLEYAFGVTEDDPDFRDVCRLVQARQGDGDTDEDRASKSQMLRDRGNRSYQSKEFSQALSEYSQSVLAAPLDALGHGREAALGLANRSAVFFEQKDFQSCLDDIEAAMDIYGYPGELAYKLHDRRGRCLEALGRGKQAREAFERAIAAVKESKLKKEKREGFEKDVHATLKSLQKNSSSSKKSKSRQHVPSPRDRDPRHRPCPFQIWEPHPSFPPLSDALDIVFSDTVGRHVVAKRDIPAGETVVIEDPIAAHLSPFKLHSNCSHCFRPYGPRVLPSPFLRRVRFCSLPCLRQALDTYHRTESWLDITDIFYGEDQDPQMSGCISLAYRALTQKSLHFFKDKRSELFAEHDVRFGTNAREKERGFSYTGEQHYRGLYNLVTHVDQMPTQDRLILLIRTIVLLKSLKISGYFSDQKDATEDSPGQSNDEHSSGMTEDELYVAKLLFHFQSGIQYNLHTVYQVDGELEAGKRIPLLDIGSGVYPTTLFFNHSCVPNTVRINQGPRVIFVSKRPIRAGEEVMECYGIHHISVPLAERQARLERGYAFRCGCEACKKNFPLLADLPGQLSPKVAASLGNPLAKYKTLFDQGKFTKAVQVCADNLHKLQSMGVPYPHRNYEIASMALCSGLWAMAKDC